MGDSVRIVLIGASGRMGTEIRSAVARVGASQDIEIVAGLVAVDDPLCGSQVEGVSTPLSSSWSPACCSANVIVEFSNHRGARLALAAAVEHRLPILVATTGLDSDDEAAVKTAAEDIPIVRARNTSLGITVMCRLVKEAAKLLGEDYDLEISEIHHKMKLDAPSGTAYALAEAAAEGKSNRLEDVVTIGRAGADAKRTNGEIGIQAIRGGNVAGEHTVYLFGENERLEITHRATSRAVFADGAVRAASWLAAKKGQPGALFDMADVLGCSNR